MTRGRRHAWPRLSIDAPGAIPALFAIALGLRLALMLTLPQQPFSDAAYYVDRAIELAAGAGYRDGGVATAFWPVGYPALLAATMTLFGPSLAGPMLLNLAATAAVLALILWFGRRVAGGERSARIAALLYALYPAHIAYAGAALSETSYTAILMLGFALLIARRDRWRGLLAAGLLFGVATLMRPQTLLFPFGALVVMTFVYRDFQWRAVRAAAIVALAMAATILPWSLRNQAALGEFVLVSTNGGVALYAGANADATGDHFAMGWERGPLWRATGVPFNERVARQAELDRRFRALAREWIAENPLRYAALGLRKAVLLWRKDSDAFWGLKYSYPQWERPLTALQWLNQAYYMLLLGLALPCFFAAARALFAGGARAQPLALLLCAPLFVTMLAFVFTGQVRYHYPAMPFIAVAAGWTLARLVTNKGRRIR